MKSYLPHAKFRILKVVHSCKTKKGNFSLRKQWGKKTRFITVLHIKENIKKSFVSINRKLLSINPSPLILYVFALQKRKRILKINAILVTWNSWLTFFSIICPPLFLPQINKRNSHFFKATDIIFHKLNVLHIDQSC